MRLHWIIYIVAAFVLYVPPARGQLTLHYTIVDAPGTGASTYLTGINNNGVISGYYGLGLTSSSFTWYNGTFTFFNVPGAVFTEANAINDSNQVAGYYDPDTTTARTGFIYDGTSFTDVQYPGVNMTELYGINNASIVVGTEEPTGGGWTGLTYDGTTFRTFGPAGDYTFVNGINNNNEVVGAVSSITTSGFLRSKGKVTVIAYPGAVLTSPNGINDNKIIVGNFYFSTDSSCFVWKNGKFNTFSIPNVKDTFCIGINNAGVIVGYVSDFGMHIAHGFYTSPVSDADFR